MTDINEQLKNDLELALNMIVGYQRAIYTLGAADPQRKAAVEMLQKYKIKPYKKSDAYAVMIEDEKGNFIDISADPEGIELDDRVGIDYTTGEAKLAADEESPFKPTTKVCSHHRVPLDANGECHRCNYDVYSNNERTIF